MALTPLLSFTSHCGACTAICHG